MKKRLLCSLFAVLILMLSACSLARDDVELTYQDMQFLQDKMNDCLVEDGWPKFSICSMGISTRGGEYIIVIGIDEQILENSDIPKSELLRETERQIRDYLAEQLEAEIGPYLFDPHNLPLAFHWDRPSKPA